MKYVVILSLFFGALFAKSSDACYSVQLKSFYLKKNSSYNFASQNYPSSCILVNISGLRSVRCGCYENYRNAEDKLDRLLNRYDDAIIVNTYKRRFSNSSSSSSDSFNDDSYNRSSSKRIRKSRRDDNFGRNDYADNKRESDYPTEEKVKEEESKQTSRSYQREDKYSKNSYEDNEKSLYEDDEKEQKRSFYGQEEEDDLYESDEPEPKQNYSHDSDSSNYGGYKKSNRDYSRSSANRW